MAPTEMIDGYDSDICITEIRREEKRREERSEKISFARLFQRLFLWAFFCLRVIL